MDLDGRMTSLLELAAQGVAGEAWQNAFKESIEHLMLVLNNNQSTPLKKILARPDVIEALSEPFLVAGEKTMANVMQVWQSQTNGVVPAADLNKVLKNIKSNTNSAQLRIRAAILNGERKEIGTRLSALALEMQRRAEYAVEYASKRGKMLKFLYDADGGKKVWHGPNAQCDACKALHGTELELDKKFSAAAGGRKLSTFGPLLGPPRHPGCNCELNPLNKFVAGLTPAITAGRQVLLSGADTKLMINVSKSAVEALELKLSAHEALVALSASDLEYLGYDDNLLELAAGCSLDMKPGKSNWVEKGGGLPNYICEVAKGILDGKRDQASISRAISIAVGRVKVWAVTSKDAGTKAKAAAAVAQWEKLKAKSKAD